MKANAEGKYPYNGVVDCIRKSVAREGVTGLWTGLPTFYFRVAPHAMIVRDCSLEFETNNALDLVDSRFLAYVHCQLQRQEALRID